MGCTNSAIYTKTSCHDSKDARPQNKEKQKAELTESEKRIAKSTWNYMTRDLSGNGLRLFLKIFELCPEAKKLFQVDNISSSDLARNQVLRGHGTRFMNAIGAAVNCLDESAGDQDNLREVLFVLGQQHKRYSGFKPEYFEQFYEALMSHWKQCMGTRFTPEVSTTWSHVFVYMIEQLKEGYLSEGIQ